MSLVESFAAAIEDVVSRSGYAIIRMPVLLKMPDLHLWQFRWDEDGRVPFYLVGNLTGTTFVLTPRDTNAHVFYDLSDPDSLDQIARSLDRHRIER